MPVRVAAVQIELGRPTYRQAIEAAQQLVKTAADGGAQIVCLPEHWLLQYREHGQIALQELAQTAHDAGVFVLTGANYMPNLTPTSPELRVRCSLIGPDGRLLGYQDKVHLYGAEKTVASPGSQYNVLQTSLGKLGIMICYDGMFPEAARTLALKGADLILSPSRIGYVALDPWVMYLRIRALENRLPIVAPNIFRPPRFMGGSLIVDLSPQPDGRVVLPKLVAAAGAGEKIITADVDIEQAIKLRRERFLDRQPTAYFGR